MKDEKTKTFVIETEKFLKKLSGMAGGSPCLVLIEGRPLGKKIPLVPPKVNIGRGTKSDISIDDKSVSHLHAELTFEKDEVKIADLNSTNGTFVNDKKIKKATALHEGDLVRIGTTIFKFLPGGNIEHVYHEKMRDLATIDNLTQVYNKKYITDFLNTEFGRCRTLKLPLSLILFDIDHFKGINDKYGHLAGDDVLKKTCAILKDKVLRAEDVFGRWGGEEFMLVLPETGLEKACEIAERLRLTVEKCAYEYEKNRFSVTISLGVSEMTRATAAASDLLREADEALYKAKRLGRNQVCVI